MQASSIIDEAISLVTSQAESYRQELDALKRRVDEYSKLATSSELREALETIVNYNLMQEQASLTRPELINKVKFTLRLLFSNPLTGQVHIPLDFWHTSLGELINKANQRLTPFLDALNPSEAAREAGVSRQTIYHWIEQGRILPIWVNRHPFFLKLDLLQVERKVEREGATPGYGRYEQE
jgi:hypothetical protein